MLCVAILKSKIKNFCEFVDFRFFAALRTAGFWAIVREGTETLPYAPNIKFIV